MIDEATAWIQLHLREFSEKNRSTLQLGHQSHAAVGFLEPPTSACPPLESASPLLCHLPPAILEFHGKLDPLFPSFLPISRTISLEVQTMNRIAAILSLVICLVANGLLSAQDRSSKDQPDKSRPNIILIMSDDMGYSDIGCYGGEIHTPNLDGLAEGGIRFTQFYNTGRCCPTRGSLLTGLYPHQAGIGHMLGDRGLPGYTTGLNRHCLTIGEAMRTAGYRTYATGKWHVTKETRPSGEHEKFNWPLQRGFDHFFGTIHGAGSFYDPNSLTRDNELICPDSPDFFYTDAISENAAQYIRDHAKDHMATGRSSCTWPSRRPIGPCTRGPKTSKNTTASTTAVGTPSATRATNA